jgi:hypothetical protein
MAERQEFSFTPGELGIVSTEEIIEAGENFLNSDPNDLTFIKNKPKKEDEPTEEEDDQEEQDQSSKKKPTKEKSAKKPVREVVQPSKEVRDTDLLDMLEADPDEEEDEQEEEAPLEAGKKKIGGQKEKVETGEEEEGAGSEEEEESNPYSTIAKELLNHGIFSLSEGEEEVEIDTPEELLERFQLESRKQAADVIDKFLGRYGDDYKDMFENVFVRGVKPLDYLNRYAAIENINGLDIEQEADQEKVVRELYRSEGRSAEYIEKKITQHKNYGDLAEEATEAKKILVQRELLKTEKAAQTKQQEIERKQHIRREYLGSVTRILNDKLKTKDFDGIPVDRNFAEKILGYVTEERFQTPDKQLLTEFDKDVLDLNRPENHELKIKIAMLLQMAKEDPKLSKLAKRAVAKETGQLFKGLQRNSKGNKKETVEETKEKSTSSWFQ